MSFARDKLRINVTTKTVTTTVPIVKEGLSLVPVSENVHIAKNPKDNYLNSGMVCEIEADPFSATLRLTKSFLSTSLRPTKSLSVGRPNGGGGAGSGSDKKRPPR